ncbi:MAG: molybdopterin dinucleotide binding domain-containing protein [Candidatus Thorarchaeota archaeon]
MSRVGAKVTLISGRTLLQGRTLEEGKLTDAYRDAVSYVEIDATVFEALGIQPGDLVEVETIFGTVVVSTKKSRGKDPDIAFIPCGPYANAIIGDDTQQSGMPSYKSVDAQVFKSKASSILGIYDIMGVAGGVD